MLRGSYVVSSWLGRLKRSGLCIWCVRVIVTVKSDETENPAKSQTQVIGLWCEQDNKMTISDVSDLGADLGGSCGE